MDRGQHERRLAYDLSVGRQKHMIVAIVIFGFIFGFFMQYTRVNRNNTITGMAVLENWIPAKAMGLAIGVGMLL